MSFYPPQALCQDKSFSAPRALTSHWVLEWVTTRMESLARGGWPCLNAPCPRCDLQHCQHATKVSHKGPW